MKTHKELLSHSEWKCNNLNEVIKKLMRSK